MKKVLRILAALAAIETAVASAPTPMSAQTTWTAPVIVNAGSGLMIIGTATAPAVVSVPVVTTARPVTVGPILRVSGCSWARERGPRGWVRFRVCSHH